MSETINIAGNGFSDHEFTGIIVFTAVNCHCHDSGKPNHTEAVRQWFSSYFENFYGEQWIFTVDKEGDVGRLVGGDIGWDQPQSVSMDGHHLLVLTSEEQTWLLACLNVCRDRLKLTRLVNLPSGKESIIAMKGDSCA